MLPLLAPLIFCPSIKLKLPGLLSITFINSLVDSDTTKLTGVNDSPLKADICSPTTKL